MIGCLPTQAIAFEWKPGLTLMMHVLLMAPASSASLAAAAVAVAGSTQPTRRQTETSRAKPHQSVAAVWTTDESVAEAEHLSPV